MASVIFNKSRGSVSDAEIGKFEDEIGRRLPGGYREFLAKFNGGIPKPRCFKDDDIVNRVILFYSLDPQPDRGLRGVRVRHESDLEGHFLAIGRDLGQEPICLNLRSEDFGAIFLSDGTVEDIGLGVIMRRQAGSFEEFLESLYDPDAGKPKDELLEFASNATPEDLPGFLAKDPGMSMRSEQGWNLFQSASASGNLRLVKELLSRRVDNYEGIHFALYNHKWEVVYLLAESGVDLNEVNRDGDKPLDCITGIFGEERRRLIAHLEKHGAQKQSRWRCPSE